ncbi:hypothetical protein BMS3Abin04_00221 [bacterium BMS3Abin04]|nr:hypothetical protein BMS3Abin04_00221 [bacterium BMS3Abin04]
MSEQKERAIDVDRLLKNKLKSVSIGDLEDGIAKVVSDMVGEDYKCTIGEVKYTIFSGADFHVKIELTYNPED